MREILRRGREGLEQIEELIVAEEDTRRQNEELLNDIQNDLGPPHPHDALEPPRP